MTTINLELLKKAILPNKGWLRFQKRTRLRNLDSISMKATLLMKSGLMILRVDVLYVVRYRRLMCLIMKRSLHVQDVSSTRILLFFGKLGLIKQEFVLIGVLLEHVSSHVL